MQSLPTLGAPKIALPRLSCRDSQEAPGEKKDPSDSQRGPRVGRACLSCRRRKVKCSGDTPRCANCIASHLECVYDQARRDRLKSATSKNKDLVVLLKELSLSKDLNDTDKSRIHDALESYEDDAASAVSVKSLKRRKLQAPDETENVDDEDDPYAAIRASDALGSDEGLALVNEDLLRSRKSRSTGYVGQGAEVHWLRSLQNDLSAEGVDQKRSADANHAIPRIEHPAAENTRPAGSLTEASFYLDSDSAELDIDVEPREMPPREIAEKLLECYMRTVHKSFPIIPAQFEDQFRRYFDAANSERPFQPPDKWLAIVNIVFAIGARYSHLINAEWQGEERDHLVYMSRTLRLLGPWPFASTPDLAMIQVSGLLSLYYQIIGHVSKGWVMIGIAIRLALALGLHLRNEDPDIPLSKKETLLRTWWSLHAIECLLSAITGRPCVLGHEDCTVPLPMTLSEEKSRSASPSDWTSPSQDEFKSPTPASSSSSEKRRRLQSPRSYLDAHLNIGLLTQKLLSSLYSPRISQRSWTYVQRTIPGLLRELNEWKQGILPDEGRLNVEIFPPPDGPREIRLLRFYYFSSKILITRPCLCRSGRETQNQSSESAKFDQRMAEVCVEAALGLSELLPDDTDPRVTYETSPWWSILHNIMQAMAVLLLELAYGEKHMRGDKPIRGDQAKIKSSVKKLLQWLDAMRHSDAVVERAHNVVINILRQRKFRASFSDQLSQHDPAQYDAQSNPPFHGHPEPSAHHTVEQAPQVPPSEWYGGHYPVEAPTSNAGFNPATADPQILAGLGPQQQYTTQMNQPQFQAEQYQFIDNPMNNPFMFSNPFMSNYDEDAPFGLTLDDLWSPGGPSGNGGPVGPQDFNYQDYPFLMDQNPQDGPQQPQ